MNEDSYVLVMVKGPFLQRKILQGQISVQSGTLIIYRDSGSDKKETVASYAVGEWYYAEKCDKEGNPLYVKQTEIPATLPKVSSKSTHG